MFTVDVQQQLQYYVYRLIDPRNGQTFYIGKGKGNRVFAHVQGALKGFWEKEEDEVSAKIQQIRDIHAAGLSVIHVIQRFGLTEKEAYEVEAALIDCFPGLTNLQRGHGDDRGVCNADVLQRELSCEEFQEREDLDYLIIKVSKESVEANNGSVYDAVRRYWKVRMEKVRHYPIVLGVVHGIVRGVFAVDHWRKPQGRADGRLEFVGKPAPNELMVYFLNKRIPEQYRKKGLASPVLYHSRRQDEY